MRRAESSRSVHGSGLFPSRGADDDRMSEDMGRTREGGALVSPIAQPLELMFQDWFMRDRWEPPMSSASAVASRRLGSVAPSSSAMPPIRKGQMVWDAERGFVRESELRQGMRFLHSVTALISSSEAPKPVHANDAERILFALESMRKTPLAEARNTPASTGGLPPELIGSSSRQLRKAINVPLATAQSGDSARSRREKNRGTSMDDASMMISPYGRRRQMDSALFEARRKEVKESEMDQGEYRVRCAVGEADEKTTIRLLLLFPVRDRIALLAASDQVACRCRKSNTKTNRNHCRLLDVLLGSNGVKRRKSPKCPPRSRKREERVAGLKLPRLGRPLHRKIPPVGRERRPPRKLHPQSRRPCHPSRPF